MARRILAYSPRIACMICRASHPEFRRSWNLLKFRLHELLVVASNGGVENRSNLEIDNEFTAFWQNRGLCGATLAPEVASGFLQELVSELSSKAKTILGDRHSSATWLTLSRCLPNDLFHVGKRINYINFRQVFNGLFTSEKLSATPLSAAPTCVAIQDAEALLSLFTYAKSVWQLRATLRTVGKYHRVVVGKDGKNIAVDCGGRLPPPIELLELRGAQGAAGVFPGLGVSPFTFGDSPTYIADLEWNYACESSGLYLGEGCDLCHLQQRDIAQVSSRYCEGISGGSSPIGIGQIAAMRLLMALDAACRESDLVYTMARMTGLLDLSRDEVWNVLLTCFIRTQRKFETAFPGSFDFELENCCELLFGNQDHQMASLDGCRMHRLQERYLIDLVAMSRFVRLEMEIDKESQAQKKMRADAFEIGTQKFIDDTAWGSVSTAQWLRSSSRKVRLGGKVLTDIDAGGGLGDTLLMVSCKSRTIARGHVDASMDDNRNVSTKIDEYVVDWQDRIARIARSPVGDNYDVTKFKYIIGVVCIPTLSYGDGVSCAMSADGLYLASTANELHDWLLRIDDSKKLSGVLRIPIRDGS